MSKTILGAMAAVLWVATAQAEGTPAQTCQASKNRTAEMYAACRESAEAKLASTGDTTKYDDAIARCEAKYQVAWQRAEQKAVADGSACTTTDDQEAVQDVSDEYTENVAQHLVGSPLRDCPGDLATCSTDLATCNAGTAAAGDVLSGRTFSSGAGLGVTGTMANNGAVTLTPSTTDQSLAAGYHNGAGKCVGDPDLVTGNLKSGVNLFGVDGDANVVDTAGATAISADMLSGKTAYVNGSIVIGSVPAGADLSGDNGLKSFTIPDGLYLGSKTATANDANLAAANIKSGVTIFGVTGTFFPATCGNGLIDGTEQCDLGTLDSQTCVTQGFVGGTLRCAAACLFDTSACYVARYVDHSNGAVTDAQTGLMWEKKVKKDSTADLANLQDADNRYAWAGTCSITATKYCQLTAAASAACTAGVEGPPTGCEECTGGEGTCSSPSTVWTWLVALNAANFAAHDDWRLAKTNELEGLVDYADSSAPVINVEFHGASCGTGCTDITDPACACTQSSLYWSASTYALQTASGWTVYFSDGYVDNFGKTSIGYVRAVRSGL